MTAAPALEAMLAELCGEPVRRLRPLGGGDVGTSYCAELASGRCTFAKTLPRGPTGALACEAEGLAWLREAAALRVPEVLGFGDSDRGPALALEWIEPGRPADDHAEQLGRGLAAPHRAGAPDFGLGRDNFIATLPQRNDPTGDWPRFYAQRRLAPLVAQAARAGAIDAALERRFDALAARLPQLVGAAEAPARLHGDLWSGNALCDEGGRPVLIDPAVYGGHREVDLAMMALFGGFSDRVVDAYDEAFPLAPDWRERTPLYQLYPLLVHVNLFGTQYLRPLVEALSRYE